MKIDPRPPVPVPPSGPAKRLVLIAAAVLLWACTPTQPTVPPASIPPGGATTYPDSTQIPEAH